jgi:hypothetical protein
MKSSPPADGRQSGGPLILILHWFCAVNQYVRPPTRAHKSIRMRECGLSPTVRVMFPAAMAVNLSGSRISLPAAGRGHNLPARPRGFVPTPSWRGGGRVDPMRQVGEQRLGFIIMGSGPAEAGRWKKSRKIGEADSTAMPNPLSLVLNHWSNTHFILDS